MFVVDLELDHTCEWVGRWVGGWVGGRRSLRTFFVSLSIHGDHSHFLGLLKALGKQPGRWVDGGRACRFGDG